MVTRISPRDYEYLSAYLDGQLKEKAAQRLEARLAKETLLRDEYKEMQRMRVVLRSLPRQQVPRNFTLTPAMAGYRQQKSTRLYPVLGFASALASILFVLVVLGDFLGYVPSAPRVSESAAVQEAAPLAMAPQEATADDEAQMRSAAPPEESVAVLEADAMVTDEVMLKSVVVEEDVSSLQMTIPDSITPTETIELAQAEAETSVAEQAFGTGGGIYSDTLEMPMQVFVPTQPAELPETSSRMEEGPTPTCTPTPMPTETPLPTEIPVSTATPTPTPMPTETPVASFKLTEQYLSTATPTMEILAMVGEEGAGESTVDPLPELYLETTELLPQEQASQPTLTIRPVLIIQIGLLVLAVLTGAAFLVLRFKEN